jgi:DNA-binding transcriptional regulator PaaX
MSDLWSNKWHGFKDPLEMLFPDIWGMRDYLWERYKKVSRDKARKRRFYRIISYLKVKGYLNIKDLKNRKAVIITPKGMEKVLRTELKFGDRKKRKDRKWQMIFFDIPEKRRKDRDYLRKYLGYLVYKKLQQSIWVCPYDVLKETQQIIKNYKLERFIRLLLVEEVKI